MCEIRFGLFIGRGEGDPARIPNNFERTERSSGGVRSECVIPRPAVIQLSSPGRIGSHLSLRGWQRPPHGKAAEIPRAGDDDYVNRVTGECFTRLRIDGRLPALGEIASDVRNPSRLAVGLPRYLGETGFDRCQELLRLEGLMQATRPIKGVKSVPGAFGQNRVDAFELQHLSVVVDDESVCHVDLQVTVSSLALSEMAAAQDDGFRRHQEDRRERW